MNAGMAEAAKDVQSTFDRVTWVDATGMNEQAPRVVVPFTTHTGRHTQTTLSADDSAHEFHRALGVALTVISEFEQALRATQDVRRRAYERLREDHPDQWRRYFDEERNKEGEG